MEGLRWARSEDFRLTEGEDYIGIFSHQNGGTNQVMGDLYIGHGADGFYPAHQPGVTEEC